MKLTVSDANQGTRLDIFLLSAFRDKENITRSSIAKYINSFVKVNGKEVKKGHILKQGDIIDVNEDILKQSSNVEDTLVATKGPLNIIDETSDYIVINKPKGVAVHPGRGNLDNTIANYLKYYLLEKNEYDIEVKRGGIVHRLDKQVGGILLCAKNRDTQLYFQHQFEQREVVKLYLANIVALSSHIPSSVEDLDTQINLFVERGYRPDDSWIKIEGNISRSRSNRMTMEIGERGKNTLTYIKLLSNHQALINIQTGRMHQIRATIKSLGWVIENDTLYGDKNNQTSVGIGLDQILLRVKLPSGVFKVWRLV